MDKLRSKFFSDPDWIHVQKLLMGYVDDLVKFNDVDLTMPAEHVKAELVGRTKLYEKVVAFLDQTGLVEKPKKGEIKRDNPFA